MTNKVNRITGSQRDAETWVNSSLLPNPTKKSLLHFIHKFPTLEYYKLGKATTLPEPEWLQLMSGTLRGFMPNMLVWIQLDRFVRPARPELKLNEIWYHRMFTTDVSSEYERILLDQRPLLVLYSWLENLGSILAVKADDSTDQSIYEFSYDDVVARSESEGQIPREAASVVFNSYTEMLEHIVAVKLQTGEIIQAQR